MGVACTPLDTTKKSEDSAAIVTKEVSAPCEYVNEDFVYEPVSQSI